MDVEEYPRTLSGVCEVHDLHVWPMGTTEVALTAHLVVVWPERPPPFLSGLEHELQSRFGVHHTTVQLEPLREGISCRLAPADVV